MVSRATRARQTHIVDDGAGNTETETAVKKSNIYKVVTTFPETPVEPGDPVARERTDYVRAKTLAGAAATIAKRYVKASLATQDDLIKLAGVTVVEG